MSLHRYTFHILRIREDPADSQPLNNVVSTTMRRRVGVSTTLFRRPVPVRVTTSKQSYSNGVSTSMRHGVAST